MYIALLLVTWPLNWAKDSDKPAIFKRPMPQRFTLKFARQILYLETFNLLRLHENSVLFYHV